MERRMSTSGGRDAREQPRRNGGYIRPAHALVWRLVLVALGTLALMAAAGTPVTRADEGSPTLNIVTPQQLTGPAGTNVTAQLQGAPHKHTYVPGYAPASSSCTAGFVGATAVQPITTDDRGNGTLTIPWPAESGTGAFFLCAQDMSNPTTTVQSSNQFTVLSTTPPSITIAPAPTSTATAGGTTSSGTPVAPTANGPSGPYTTGQQVVVTGAGFLPGGSTIAVYIGGDANVIGSRLTDNPINADTNGDFTVTVTLPPSRAGSLFLQAATLDGGNGTPPSLLAAAPLTVQLVATPTPTVPPSPTPSPTVPTTSPTPPTGTSGGDTGRTLGIAGLGGFSVLLLVIGTFLLATAGRPTAGGQRRQV